jgi:hypothetical protein
VDSDAATSEEKETRGALRASLTVEGVAVAKADRIPMRCRLLRAPKMDKRQQGSKMALTLHKNGQWKISPADSFGGGRSSSTRQ